MALGAAVIMIPFSAPTSAAVSAQPALPEGNGIVTVCQVLIINVIPPGFDINENCLPFMRGESA